MGKILNLRDAICQTSDTETKYFAEIERKRISNSRSPLDRRDSRRSYDYRRATADALLQQPGYGIRGNEGNSFLVCFFLHDSNVFDYLFNAIKSLFSLRLYLRLLKHLNRPQCLECRL